MAKWSTLTGLFLIIAGCFTANILVHARIPVETLRVDNGGIWGDWGRIDFCERGTYAIGYSMKIEGKQGRGDDTSLNGVSLTCGDIYGKPSGSYASSSSGHWGRWLGEARCEHGQVISAFQLQVEGQQGRGDDTAANFMKVRCRYFETSAGENEKYIGNGSGFWGSYGSWSKSCSANHAVCGIRTKIERPQGRGDDTALNDIQLFCCSRDEQFFRRFLDNKSLKK